MNYKVLGYILCVLSLITPYNLTAQIEQDIEAQDSIMDVKNKSEFQPKFFKALSERGIENYEKANEILLELKKDYARKTVIFFQLGLNYYDLEQYNLALDHFKKADELKPNNFDIREQLFKVYEQQKKYDQAIELANSLAERAPEYFEVSANLYLITKRYSKALEALSTADDKMGFSPLRDQLREIIFEANNKPEVAIKYYKKRIALEPYNPLNAYRLVTALINKEKYDQALEASTEMIKNHPRFTRAYVLKTLIHLNLNEVEEAFKALEVVVSDRFLEEKYKVQAIEYVKSYVETHPEYQNEFIQLLNVASQTAENSASYLDLGLFYYETDKPRSLKNFRKALSQNPQDFQILKYISILELQLNNTQAVIEITDEALEIYPTQAIFMLLKGQALLEQTQYNAAESVLLEAESYIFEENNMMLNLYESLQRVYKGLNEEQKSKTYQVKTKQLKDKLK